MSWSKRLRAYRKRVLDALGAVVREQTDLAENPGDEGSRLHREWAGAAQDAIDLLTGAAPAKRVKGYPRTYALQILVVEGRGRFPLEMLDRDLCLPGTEADALRMYRDTELEGGRIAVRRVVLRRFIQPGGTTPHHKRWGSFGWRVVWFGTAEEYMLRPAELGEAPAQE